MGADTERKVLDYLHGTPRDGPVREGTAKSQGRGSIIESVPRCQGARVCGNQAQRGIRAADEGGQQDGSKGS